MRLREFAGALLGSPSVSSAESRAISYQQVFATGGDWSQQGGREVSAEAALGLPAVLSCVDLIAGAVSTMPLQTFRTVDELRQRAPDGPLVKDPSAVWAPDEWVYVAVASKLLFGEAIGLITAIGGNGWPSRVEWVDPRQCDVERQGNVLRYRVNGDRVPADRVVHSRYGILMPGAVRGQSPISLLRTPLRTGLEQMVYELDWFRGGGHPTGIIGVDVDGMNDEEATVIADRFVAKTRTRRPVVMARVLKYEQVQADPTQSGLAEARRRVATEVANVFHVPPEMVGGEAGKSMTYSTLETDQLALDVRALMPAYSRLERALSRQMPSPQYVRFNADAQIRASLRDRAEVGEILLRSGQRSPDEVRSKDELPPIPGGVGAKFNWPPKAAAPAPPARRRPVDEEDPDEEEDPDA